MRMRGTYKDIAAIALVLCAPFVCILLAGLVNDLWPWKHYKIDIGPNGKTVLHRGFVFSADVDQRIQIKNGEWIYERAGRWERLPVPYESPWNDDYTLVFDASGTAYLRPDEAGRRINLRLEQDEWYWDASEEWTPIDFATFIDDSPRGDPPGR